jgi:hypothetical protein
MLVICAKTGLTYDRKIYSEGDIFILSGSLEREFEGLSGDRFERKQKKIYSDVLFRLPTSGEIIEALQSKKLTITAASKEHLSKSQLKIALEYAKSKKAKELAGIEMIQESLDVEVEEAPEPVEEAPQEEPAEPEAPEEEAEKAEEEAEAPPEEPVKKPVKGKGKGKGKKK